MKKYSIILLLITFMLGSCDDFLDRKPLSEMNDANFWKNENSLRLFANGFYTNYFVGYNSGFGVEYCPLRGFTFADDFASTGKQANFEAQAPASRSSTSEAISMLSNYSGPTWNFAWVRKANLFLERIEEMKGSKIDDASYLHWSAVAKFFRGYEYSRLVSTYGDVPYYDHVLAETEINELYKDRDSRTDVMDKVYDDFQYVLDNMRLSDGATQYLNRYIAAAFISRFMLFEGTWQKYHLGNNAKAQKYLDMAVKAGDLVIASNKWTFTSNFKDLFGSDNLSSNAEVLLYRTYDGALGITHSIASYSNISESQSPAVNLSLIKSFIATDGKPYKLSAVPNATTLDLANLIKTRDPRFEATFWNVLRNTSNTLLYASKFIDRVGPTYLNGTYPPQYGSNTNTNDAPVMRLGEVVLNWIEAKAELESIGVGAVTQADIDASINRIRNRPIDATAAGRGVVKTAPLSLAAVPDDPDRDLTVSPLLWEIRRERRMEFVFEHTRLLDLRRWKKLDYMNGATNPDILLSLWVNFPAEKAANTVNYLVPAKANILKVKLADGTIVTYNGTNDASMIGYYIPENISNRDPFTDRVYLAPLGNNEINQYAAKGFTLTQTPGW